MLDYRRLSSLLCGVVGKIHSVFGCGKGFKWDKARHYKARFQDFNATAAQDDDGIVQLTGAVWPARLCRDCMKPVQSGTCFEELSSLVESMNENPVQLLR